jgi:hypothetical protein
VDFMTSLFASLVWPITEVELKIPTASTLNTKLLFVVWFGDSSCSLQSKHRNHVFLVEEPRQIALPGPTRPLTTVITISLRAGHSKLSHFVKLPLLQRRTIKILSHRTRDRVSDEGNRLFRQGGLRVAVRRLGTAEIAAKKDAE